MCSTPKALGVICTRTYSVESKLSSHEGPFDIDELTLMLKTQSGGPSGERHSGDSLVLQDVCGILQGKSDSRQFNNRISDLC